MLSQAGYKGQAQFFISFFSSFIHVAPLLTSRSALPVGAVWPRSMAAAHSAVQVAAALGSGPPPSSVAEPAPPPQLGLLIDGTAGELFEWITLKSIMDYPARDMDPAEGPKLLV